MQIFREIFLFFRVPVQAKLAWLLQVISICLTVLEGLGIISITVEGKMTEA
jgi:hypothetical protein